MSRKRTRGSNFGITLGEQLTGESHTGPTKGRSSKRKGGLSTEQKLRFDDDFRKKVAMIEGAPEGIGDRSNYNLSYPTREWIDTVRELLLEEKEDPKNPGRTYQYLCWMLNYKNEPRLALGTVQCQQTLVNGERCLGRVPLTGWKHLVELQESPEASQCEGCRKAAKFSDRDKARRLRSLTELSQRADELESQTRRRAAEEMFNYVLGRLNAEYDKLMKTAESTMDPAELRGIIPQVQEAIDEIDDLRENGMREKHIKMWEEKNGESKEATPEEVVVAEVVEEVVASTDTDVLAEQAMAELEEAIAAK